MIKYKGDKVFIQCLERVFYKMKRQAIYCVGITVLLLPFIGTGVAKIAFGKNIFDNPDFWYGYMAYFGTVSLAMVSWLQSIKTEEISNKFVKQQLRQKIGYFELKQESGEIRKIRPYQFLQNGQRFDAAGVEDKSEDIILGIYLKNVGEDVILNVQPISSKINGELMELPCSIRVIYKNEEIMFELNNTKHYQDEKIKVELLIRMENLEGIIYEQYICIDAKRINTTELGTYLVEVFDTHFDFGE